MKRTFVCGASYLAWKLFENTGNPSYMSLFMNLEHNLIPVNELEVEREKELEMGM